MNLEEMLLRERDRPAPNPLMHRTGEIIARVRRRRRARAAAAGAVSVAVLAVMAVLAGQLLPAEISPSDVSPSEPIVTDAAAPSQVPADSPLDPGRYVVSVADASSADAGNAVPPLLPVLSVPEGFQSLGFGIGAFGVRTPDFERYVGVWDVPRVYPHPCDAISEPVGPSVADLANALAAQPLRSGTDPVPVTVGGYDGLYVELSVPAEVDVSACPSGVFSLWPGRAQHVQEILGQVDMVWIVDVDGQRITFDAAHMPNVSPDKVAELKNIVTTATFTPADGD